MIIATLLRELRPEIEYAEFRRAWLPDTVLPNDPRRVLTARNLANPRQLLTVALADADPAELPYWLAKLGPGEQRRAERMRHMFVGDPLVNEVFEVIADDDLSQPLR